MLNQFFAELANALEQTNGHYAQFNGDGLMAIYGLDTDAETGASQALAGAQAMLDRVAQLNQRLESELSDALRIGIGIHAGEAVVGSMGPPANPIVTALGDNVNIAARLEAETKKIGVPLVISAAVADFSGADMSGFQRHTITVKGRQQSVEIFGIDRPAEIVHKPDVAAG